MKLLVAPIVLFATSALHAQAVHYAMDYGPFLSGTVEAAWPEGNTTLKAIVVHSGSRDDASTVVFDTELLRVAGMTSKGWLALRGTPYDGGHGPVPALRGRQILGTRAAPGWANAGSFADPRAIPHGPLPRAWGRYHGLYVNRQDVVIEYDIGGTRVREHYARRPAGGAHAVVRTLNIAASQVPMQLRVLDDPSAQMMFVDPGMGLEVASQGVKSAPARNILGVMMRPAPKPQRVMTARTSEAWGDLPSGAPSAADYADAKAGHGVTVRYVESFAKPSPRSGAVEGSLPRLVDGNAAANDDQPDQVVFFSGGVARIVMDLQRTIDVSRITTFSRHKGRRAAQRYRLFGTAAAAPKVDGKNPAKDGWQLLANVDTRKLGRGGMQCVSVGARDGTLGSFRHLLWIAEGQGKNNGTFFTEFDVYDTRQRAGVDRQKLEGTLTAVAARGLPERARWQQHDGGLHLSLPPHSGVRCSLVTWGGAPSAFKAFTRTLGAVPAARDLDPLCKGGPARWTTEVKTKGRVDKSAKGPWAVDMITVPEQNPWKSRMRCCGFDFFSDGRLAVSTWNGDVWVVSGIDADLDELQWKRFATGLFDPLGLKIVDDVVYTLGRDQITKLQDLNRDGEADFYECFNNQVLITKSFHEFAFDLQRDAAGYWYFSKGGPVRPGGRGFDKIVPHHGCILRVAPDGSNLEVYATGFRAPNGIGVSPDGRVTSGDNEGTWMPRCRLNWVEPGGFHGVMDLAHRSSPPETYDLPLCFMPMHIDNSSGGQVWVTSDRWGPFQGDMLHLSYGRSSIYKVLKETVDGQIQGGVVRIPVQLGSSAMRGRFSPIDHQLYVCGFKGWQTNAARDTALQRVRYTGKAANLPTGLRVTDKGIYITFTDALDKETAGDVEGYAIEQWDYLWTERYGSPEISKSNREADIAKARGDWNKFKSHDKVDVKAARVSADGKTVFLEIPDLQPVMQMEIKYNVDAADGSLVKGAVYNTIHKIGPDTGMPGAK